MNAGLNDTDPTLTSPLWKAFSRSEPLLGLTIVWHPDPARIGAQYLDTGGGALEVGRYAPLFCHPGEAGAVLELGAVSRQALRIVKSSDGGVRIVPPDSRMVVELNGRQCAGEAVLERAQITAGAMLGLGRSVLLCMHWMDCLPGLQQVEGLVGVGSASVRTRELIRGAAAVEAPVLLLGETGTGKEVAARAIHALGRRAARPLVAVNMAALGESLAAAELFGAAKGAYTGAATVRHGLFEEADGATLFLDEIGNTPPLVQPMLLRVLENGVYRAVGSNRDQRSTARLITATDQDLYGAGFNQALLRRLEGFVIALAPLRERREDIGVLLRHLAALDQATYGPSPALTYALASAFALHDWPGNVRQLSHVLGRVLLALRMGQAPALADFLPAPARAGIAIKAAGGVAPAMLPARRRQERGAHDVLAALDGNDWLIQRAALALGVSRPTMYKLIATHPQIRRAESIDRVELRSAMAAGGDDVRRCAAMLKTPAEALRRHLRLLGMVD